MSRCSSVEIKSLLLGESADPRDHGRRARDCRRPRRHRPDPQRDDDPTRPRRGHGRGQGLLQGEAAGGRRLPQHQRLRGQAPQGTARDSLVVRRARYRPSVPAPFHPPPLPPPPLPFPPFVPCLPPRQAPRVAGRAAAPACSRGARREEGGHSVKQAGVPPAIAAYLLAHHRPARSARAGGASRARPTSRSRRSGSARPTSTASSPSPTCPARPAPRSATSSSTSRPPTAARSASSSATSRSPSSATGSRSAWSRRATASTSTTTSRSASSPSSPRPRLRDVRPQGLQRKKRFSLRGRRDAHPHARSLIDAAAELGATRSSSAWPTAAASTCSSTSSRRACAPSSPSLRTTRRQGASRARAT